MPSQKTVSEVHRIADLGFEEYRGRFQSRFLSVLAESGGRLFTTDADGPMMFGAYLSGFDQSSQQYHTCHACRRFFDVFGGLVTIDESGRTHPALWHEEDAPDHYRASVALVARLVSRAKVNGVFLSSAPVWGQPVTGEWTHFAVTPPKEYLHRHSLLTAGQSMAEKKEDYANVCRALGEFNAATIATALRLLETDSLYCSEKVIGPAKWLADLHAARDSALGKDGKNNVVWRAVASAPAGFCHPRSSMIGSLLEDIAAGMDFAEVSRRFAAKMHPLQYQRPQAAPSAGNIAEAEKIVEKLGIARSLERRFARLDEVQAIWRPVEPKPETPGGSGTGGVFSHIKPKEASTSGPAMQIPAVTMTWAKFSREVLPGAESIEILAPTHGNYMALTTAVHADAPPILQWDNDREDARNPVAWYLYMNGSPATQWGLVGGRYHKVNALTLCPAHWSTIGDNNGSGGPKHSHQTESIIFIIDGAKDLRSDGSGLAIFPETLRSELHGIRSTIEAFSRAGKLAGAEEASACGLALQKRTGGSQADWDARVRVFKGGMSQNYRLDRWD